MAEFAAMEEAGIVRRSNTPWSSLLHMVEKKIITHGWEENFRSFSRKFPLKFFFRNLFEILDLQIF